MPLPDHRIVRLAIGKAQPFSQAGSLTLQSAMVKGPVDALQCQATIVAGDEHFDPKVHGGPNRVVHHIPAESYEVLSRELPAGGFDAGVVHPGALGENVSTTGLSPQDVCIGDVIQAGTAVLQVRCPVQAAPCGKGQAGPGVCGVRCV